jgi:protein-S-isoprenylcysteine O-methyltransferase Ste14
MIADPAQSLKTRLTDFITTSAPYLFVPGLKERPWTALRIAGAVLAVVGYTMFVTARLQLGKSFAVTPQAKELVTLGLYSRIRNPIYVFVEVMIFGLVLSMARATTSAAKHAIEW